LRFAWQGFSFELPDDIHPVSLSGSLASGYAGLAASEGPSIQVRWQRSKLPPSQQVLETYLARLNRDAQKKKRPFDGHIWKDEEDLRFQYATGEGALISRSGRVFFVEVSAPSKRSRTATAKQVLCSFHVEDTELLSWHILGLQVRIPKQLTLQRKELIAGKTALDFSSPLTHVRAERWGAADQLLTGTTLAQWLAALLNAKSAIEESPTSASLTLQSPLKTPLHAKAIWQVEQNQVTLVRSTTRQHKMRPQWDWFD
jgi:hypothetical protein